MWVVILVLLIGSITAANAEEPQPSVCTPIGLTAAGELVFPMSCEPVLAKIRGPAGTENPDAKPPGVKSPEKPETVLMSPPSNEMKPSGNSQVASTPATEEKVLPAARSRKKLSGKQRRPRPSSVETTGSINR